MESSTGQNTDQGVQQVPDLIKIDSSCSSSDGSDCLDPVFSKYVISLINPAARSDMNSSRSTVMDANLLDDGHAEQIAVGSSLHQLPWTHRQAVRYHRFSSHRIILGIIERFLQTIRDFISDLNQWCQRRR